MIGIASGLLTLAAWIGFAQAETTSGPSAARRVHETAVVTSIDRAHRSVTLQEADGETRTIGVPPDIKAFDGLKVGDHVDVDYYQSIAVALMPPGTKASMTESTRGGRVSPGAGAGGRTIVATVQIVSVDEAMNRVTFKDPAGNVRTVTVYDPAMQKKLSSLQPGQMVQVTYREAMAAAIRPSPAKK